MTPDQWQQLLAFGTALATAVGGNNVMRSRQVKKQVGAHTELRDELQGLRGEIQGLRTELADTRDKMVRLEVRIEATEHADIDMGKKLDQSQVEMHSLSGRIDAATGPITEILQMVKFAKEKAAGQAMDNTEPPVTGTVTFKEEKKS